jgi:hypothetical protein
LIGYKVERFLAGVEAIHPYEGVLQVNLLIVSRAVTCFGTFV